jgi:hypothetical protein
MLPNPIRNPLPLGMGRFKYCVLVKEEVLIDEHPEEKAVDLR